MTQFSDPVFMLRYKVLRQRVPYYSPWNLHICFRGFYDTILSTLCNCIDPVAQIGSENSYSVWRYYPPPHRTCLSVSTPVILSLETLLKVCWLYSVVVATGLKVLPCTHTAQSNYLRTRPGKRDFFLVGSSGHSRWFKAVNHLFRLIYLIKLIAFELVCIFYLLNDFLHWLYNYTVQTKRAVF